MRTLPGLPLRLAFLVLLGAASGCGPKEGDPCTGERYRCEGGAAVLECRAGHWLSIPCGGSSGCGTTSAGVTCDISGNQAGDGCPTAMEGSGFCRGTPPSLFVCRGQLIQKVADCSSCTVTTSNVICNP